MPHPLGRELFEHWPGFVHQLAGACFDFEAITLLVPDGTQHAGGIVHKRKRMQHAQDTAFEIGQAPPIIVEFAIVTAIQPQRQGVDGEIAAVQVELDAATFDGRQRSGMFVKLGTGRDQV